MSSYHTIRSDSIQTLRNQISHLDFILNKNHQKQRDILSFLENLRRQNSNEHLRQTFIAIDSIKAQHTNKELDVQSTSKNQIGESNVQNDDDDDDDCFSQVSSTTMDDFHIQPSKNSSHFVNPCIYNNLLDRIQRLEQYLTRSCRHCQQTCLPLNKSNIISSLSYNNNAPTDVVYHTESSPISSSQLENNHQQPIIMQGYIDNQSVTLFNRSAVEYVTKLKQIHVKRDSLEKSYKNVLELISNRNRYLSEMNSLLNEYNERLHAIENIKYLEDMLQNQNWDDLYKSIIQIKTQSLFMSKIIKPKNFHRNENLERLFDMLNGTTGTISSGNVSPKSNIKEVEQKERKLKNKIRIKKQISK
ncbi:hypothetical protein I4U23_008341 [Adineta vaga]|nr:hypothetical protein I4U23_008341 [Adineta vaga]